MKRLLIANRGEIAVRIARTAARMGIETVAVFSDADAHAPHTRAATFAVRIGPPAPSESYAHADAVIDAARRSGADAVHPGYGFLAENAEFAARCRDAGFLFVGPPAEAMRAVGDKATAKRLLAETQVPVLLGYDGEDQRDETLLAAAGALGAPLMIKASAGGGGRGMRLVRDLAAFPAALAAARSEALGAFGSADVLLERALTAPRHIEVQVFGDRFGNVVHLGERDCSVQRRHQKLIEESPSPFVDAPLRERLAAAALTVARAASYENAGTVEFLVGDDGAFFFIEMNARLQVEHPVTEAVTGLDLVEWQLRVARGEPLPRRQDEIFLDGHAIEARLCAEDPENDFLPQTGTLARWEPDARLRIDHALEPGIAISPFYDSMIAKFVAAGANREAARGALVQSLRRSIVLGIATNREALIRILESEPFARGNATTALIESLPEHRPQSPAHDLALAAALRYRARLAGSAFGEFGGWSTTAHPGALMLLSRGASTETTLVRARGSFVDVECVVDGTTIRVAFAPGGGDAGVDASIANGPWQAYAIFASGDGVQFSSATGEAAFTDRTRASAERTGTAALDGILRAPMSGRIVRIDAPSGASVPAATALIVLEAMKMEHHLTLSVPVTVASLEAVVGEQVTAGQILLRYDV